MATKQLRDFVNAGRKIVAAGLNYKAILSLQNVEKPSRPIIFVKSPNTYITEGQNIKLPKDLVDIVHEVELGVVIGKKCKDVSEKEAMNFVGGYCLALDLTALTTLTDYRKIGNPWSIPKCFDTALPVSRFISKDEVADPHNLDISCRVNGVQKMHSNTSDLIFRIPSLIAYITRYMTLEPADVILTGSPPGFQPLQTGDVVEAELGNFMKIKFKVD